MNYQADIAVREDIDRIYKTLQLKKLSRERSTISIKKGKEALKITIEARDAVALRASVNAVSQALAVYSKMKGVK